MTAGFHMKCLGCEANAAATVRVLACPDCGGLYEIEYEDPALPDGPRPPLTRPGERLSLGEGGTPVIELKKTARDLGLGRLWAKLENVAPTGSFKDRGSSVLISAAIENGITEFVEDSSGNAGASLAAYAAAAGIKAHVFVPASASAGKVRQIGIFGAELHSVAGPRQAATDAARAFVRERGLVYLSHNYSPYFSEGMKAFSYEAAASGARSARHVVVPTGNGSLLVGAWRGYLELIEAGVVDESPRFHCVQAENVSPIVAVIQGESWDFDRPGTTIAAGIAVSKPPRLEQVVDAVKGSGGTGVAVGDSQISEWQARLARVEGLYCELTSAAAFAGLEALVRSRVIERGDEVLVPITGSGLKDAPPA